MNPHLYLWVVDVLHPEGQRVLAVGDHGLANAVASFGFETMVATDPDTCDVLLIPQSLDVGCDPDGNLLRPEASIVAVHVPTWSRLFGFGLPGRLAMLALTPLIERRTTAKVNAARQRLEAMGYRCRTVSIGNGHGPSELASEPGATPGLRDRPSGSVLVAHRPAVADDGVSTTVGGSRRGSSLVDAVRLDAEERLDRHVTVDRVVTMSSQKVRLHVSDRDSSSAFVISIGVGTAIDLLEQSLESRRILGDRDLPDRLRRRIVWPIADGCVGPARYLIEPSAVGSPVSKLSSGIVRDDCVEFMCDLFDAGGDGSIADDKAFLDRLDTWCREISLFLDPADERSLSKLHELVADGVRGLPLGFTHGDFWPGNIFKAHGRLSAVLDWDDSSPHGLPFIDAFDFAATTARGHDNTDPGPRLVNWLWPLLHEQPGDIGGVPVGHFDLPVEVTPNLLRTLGVAYWLERISRQLRLGYRVSNRRWTTANLRDPLRFLERELL